MHIAGFDITMYPTFSVSRLVFLRAFNGVYAIAGIRCASFWPLHTCHALPGYCGCVCS